MILDVVPLVYQAGESEILEWSAEKALRRYEIALIRLGVKKE